MSSEFHDWNYTEGPDGRLARVAASQHGVISYWQAVRAGLDKHAVGRRVKSGRWQRVRPRVYRFAGAPETKEQRLMSACLWAGSEAMLCGSSAARLWGFDRAYGGEGSEIHLLVPVAQNLAAVGVVVHRSRTLEAKDRTKRFGIPVTSLPRTLIDLAAIWDEHRLAKALDSALAKYGQLDAGWIRKECRRLSTRGRPGLEVLLGLLSRRSPQREKLDSDFEREVRVVLEATELPRPAAHYRVVENERFLAEVDFAWPAKRIALWCKGGGVHRRHGKFELTEVQESELSVAGWRVVKVTSERFENDPTGFVSLVRRALASAPRPV